jgi:hypothetical protein
MYERSQCQYILAVMMEIADVKDTTQFALFVPGIDMDFDITAELPTLIGE